MWRAIKTRCQGVCSLFWTFNLSCNKLVPQSVERGNNPYLQLEFLPPSWIKKVYQTKIWQSRIVLSNCIVLSSPQYVDRRQEPIQFLVCLIWLNTYIPPLYQRLAMRPFSHPPGRLQTFCCTLRKRKRCLFEITRKAANISPFYPIFKKSRSFYFFPDANFVCRNLFVFQVSFPLKMLPSWNPLVIRQEQSSQTKSQ